MSSRVKKVRVGVIGPGGAGRGNTLAFASRNDAEIVAASDVNENSLNALEAALRERVAHYKPASFRRYIGEYEFITMLDKEELDIVGVFSPHSLHDIHVKYALRSGRHVLVEKPMANVVGDAITLAQIAVGSSRHLVVGYQRHYEDRYVTSRQVVAEGLIGELKSFEVYLAQNWGNVGGWRLDPRFSGGGQPNDSGSHLQDIFLWITQLLPQKVTGATSNKYEDSNGNVIEKLVEIDSYSDVEMENGAKGTITILGNTKVGFQEWIILKGDRGRLELKEGIHFVPNRSSKRKPVLTQKPEGYPKSKVDQLVGLVKGDYKANYCSAINGVRTSWLTNSILEAGKGPRKKNAVVCDKILEREGYSRKFIKDSIRKYEKLNMS